jgi:hypothetical protein
MSSPLECASWMPENVALNLTNFPCNKDTDCPYGDTCVQGYCNRNDVYQYWMYDPSDPSGYNCTKLRQGTGVCGIRKEGASAFDIIGNVGPDVAQCSQQCTISAQCDTCCPQNWSRVENKCVDEYGVVKCCLTDCMQEYPLCETMSNTWKKGNLAEIINGVCNMSIQGPPVHVNPDTMKLASFSQPCVNKYAGDVCMYNDGSTTFSGTCNTCIDNVQRCFPGSMCVATTMAAGNSGMCSSSSVC